MSGRVRLDLNFPDFQAQLFSLDVSDSNSVTARKGYGLQNRPENKSSVLPEIRRMRIRIMILAALVCSGCSTASQNALLYGAISQGARYAHVPTAAQALANTATRAAVSSTASYSQASPNRGSVTGTTPVYRQQANVRQEFDDFAGHEVGGGLQFTDRGALTPLQFDSRNLLPSEQAQLMKRKVESILQRLLQTPALSTPRGFSIDQHVHLDKVASSSGIIGAKSFLLVRRVDPSASKRDPSSGALRGVGEGPVIKVHINDRDAVFGEYSKENESLGTTRESPVKMRVLHGFPVYERGNRDVVVIAKPGREPFIPVSKQRYLEGLLSLDLERAKFQREQLAAAQEPRERANLEKYLARSEAAISEKQALLNSLSAAERGEQACPSKKPKGSPFIDCNEKGATHYLALNPDYFDASRPKTGIELITIEVTTVGKNSVGDKALGTLTRQAVEQLDLSSLQNSLN